MLSRTQLVRLVAEARAAMTTTITEDMARSMDLTVSDLESLLDEAEDEWDLIKEALNEHE
jgi:hypothetical protein